MTVTRILDGLEKSNATGAEATSVAQRGFLEWSFVSSEASPTAARAALSDPAVKNAQSDAAQAFVGYLTQATQIIAAPRRRRSARPH